MASDYADIRDVLTIAMAKVGLKLCPMPDDETRYQFIDREDAKFYGEIFIEHDDLGYYVIVQPSSRLSATLLSRLLSVLTTLCGGVEYVKHNKYRTIPFTHDEILFKGI